MSPHQISSWNWLQHAVNVTTPRPRCVLPSVTSSSLGPAAGTSCPVPRSPASTNQSHYRRTAPHVTCIEKTNTIGLIHCASKVKITSNQRLITRSVKENPFKEFFPFEFILLLWISTSRPLKFFRTIIRTCQNTIRTGYVKYPLVPIVQFLSGGPFFWNVQVHKIT